MARSADELFNAYLKMLNSGKGKSTFYSDLFYKSLSEEERQILFSVIATELSEDEIKKKFNRLSSHLGLGQGPPSNS